MDDATLELIADHVHQGWMAEKQRQGFPDHAFVFGGAWLTGMVACFRCDLPVDKHHDDMLPYADLAEHVKEYDRATVRAVFDALEASGYQIAKWT